MERGKRNRDTGDQEDPRRRRPDSPRDTSPDSPRDTSPDSSPSDISPAETPTPIDPMSANRSSHDSRRGTRLLTMETLGVRKQQKQEQKEPQAEGDKASDSTTAPVIQLRLHVSTPSAVKRLPPLPSNIPLLDATTAEESNAQQQLNIQETLGYPPSSYFSSSCRRPCFYNYLLCQPAVWVVEPTEHNRYFGACDRGLQVWNHWARSKTGSGMRQEVDAWNGSPMTCEVPNLHPCLDAGVAGILCAFALWGRDQERGDLEWESSTSTIVAPRAVDFFVVLSALLSEAPCVTFRLAATETKSCGDGTLRDLTPVVARFRPPGPIAPRWTDRWRDDEKAREEEKKLGRLESPIDRAVHQNSNSAFPRNEQCLRCLLFGRLLPSYGEAAGVTIVGCHPSIATADEAVNAVKELSVSLGIHFSNRPWDDVQKRLVLEIAVMLDVANPENTATNSFANNYTLTRFIDKLLLLWEEHQRMMVQATRSPGLLSTIVNSFVGGSPCLLACRLIAGNYCGNEEDTLWRIASHCLRFHTSTSHTPSQGNSCPCGVRLSTLLAESGRNSMFRAGHSAHTKTNVTSSLFWTAIAFHVLLGTVNQSFHVSFDNDRDIREAVANGRPLALKKRLQLAGKVLAWAVEIDPPSPVVWSYIGFYCQLLEGVAGDRVLAVANNSQDASSTDSLEEVSDFLDLCRMKSGSTVKLAIEESEDVFDVVCMLEARDNTARSMHPRPDFKSLFDLVRVHFDSEKEKDSTVGVEDTTSAPEPQRDQRQHIRRYFGPAFPSVTAPSGGRGAGNRHGAGKPERSESVLTRAATTSLGDLIAAENEKRERSNNGEEQQEKIEVTSMEEVATVILSELVRYVQRSTEVLTSTPML